ncbi:IS3 family transposase [Hoyosella sp. YIM 151337]|nr:IS3 family transposase [Hoyosella sp. YIM 151337]MCW4352588.1 IS3 family transposase [Hoyosella sp. YIM 151337]
MAGRKRHTPEEIIRKLRKADELAARDTDVDEIARQLGISTATLYNWRKQYGGMKADDAKRLKELDAENKRLKRLLAEAELEKDALREIGQGKLVSPAAKRRAVTMLQLRLGCSQRFACLVVGQHRSTQRKPPAQATPADPDSGVREWLRDWAKSHPRKGYRRAWAALRAEGMVINRKKVHRLWREEGLRVPQRRRRKRTGTTTAPISEASAPNDVWAIDFQFDTTADGRTFKIASMVDEHTRESLLNIVDRSITADDLIVALTAVIARRGTAPTVLRCDNGPELISRALNNFCEGRIGIDYIPPGSPWRNGYIESFNNRLRDECLNLNVFRSILEARVVISDWKQTYNHSHRHSALNYLTPIEYAATCQPHTKAA